MKLLIYLIVGVGLFIIAWPLAIALFVFFAIFEALLPVIRPILRKILGLDT